jgi:hypothetical protein
MSATEYLFFTVRKDYSGVEHRAIAHASVAMATYVESEVRPGGLLFLKTVDGSEVNFSHNATARYEALLGSGMEEYVERGTDPRRVAVRLAGVRGAVYSPGDEVTKSKLVLRRGEGALELEGGAADHFWRTLRGPDAAPVEIEEVRGEM